MCMQNSRMVQVGQWNETKIFDWKTLPNNTTTNNNDNHNNNHLAQMLNQLLKL